MLLGYLGTVTGENDASFCLISAVADARLLMLKPGFFGRNRFGSVLVVLTQGAKPQLQNRAVINESRYTTLNSKDTTYEGTGVEVVCKGACLRRLVRAS